MPLENVNLDWALAELRAPTSKDSYLRAFGILLHSEYVSEALDEYQDAVTRSRFAGGNPLEPFADEVLVAARGMLRRLPASSEEGVDHVHALRAMMNLAGAEDADLIADALEGATDVNVREAGIFAASAALQDGPVPNPRLLAVVGGMVFDETLDIAERCDALSALNGVEAPEVDDLLVRATESDELELQIGAALHLVLPSRIQVHRERVERLVASWPSTTGGYADIVREYLAGFHTE
ncbi:hypothetical protein ACQEU6_22380 [Spirillospora sp. CA-108201]